MVYSMSGGTPYDYTSTYSSGGPTSGTTYLPMLYESTYNYSWNAGTPGATGYTFHGVSTQDSTLVESATSHPSSYGYGSGSVDVNSFTATSHSSLSGHVIDDEPEANSSSGMYGGMYGGSTAYGSSTGGTGQMHRDEQFGYVNDSTGIGSYIAGSADANFHTVEVQTFTVADGHTLNNEITTGTDEDGLAYSQNFNYIRNTAGTGTVTTTHDFHDAGQGLVVTGFSAARTMASAITFQASATLNGQIVPPTTLIVSETFTCSESEPLPDDKPANESVRDLMDVLEKHDKVKDLIASFEKGGGKIERRYGGPTGGGHNSATNEIRIDPRIKDLTTASSVLLYELLRFKNNKDQEDLDKLVTAKNNPVTRDEYARKCEDLSYKYMVEHSKTSKDGKWDPSIDMFGKYLIKGGAYEPSDKYFENLQKSEAGRAHTETFKNRYDKILVS